MFSFKCPACGKQHTVAREFQEAYKTPCIRCGQTINVTEQLIGGSRKEAAVASPEQAVTRHLPGAVGESAGGVAAGAEELTEGGDGSAGGETPPEDSLPVVDDGPDDPAEKKVRSWKKRRRKESKPPEEESVDVPMLDGPKVYRGEYGELQHPTPNGEGKPFWKQWPFLAGIAGLVLAGAAVGGYLMLAGKKPTNTKEKTQTKTSKKETPVAVTPATAAKPPSTETVVKPSPPLEGVKIAAARLADELAADPDGTNFKYDGATLEVSGLFSSIATQETPARPHALFSTEAKPVSCDLQGSPTDAKVWNSLGAGQPMTVRGIYGKDGLLHKCELVLPQAPPADARYRGKEVELVGYVDSVSPAGEEYSFPLLVFERETNGLVGLACLFRKTDEEEVKKIQPDSPVVIRGTCNGRSQRGQGNYVVRLDNCQVVYTSAPVPPLVRLDVLAFLREYEEDLRSRIPPPPGKEERIDTPLSVTSLGKELASNALAADKKYRNKVVTVSGRMADKRGNVLVLTSGDTDQSLQVRCLFTHRNFQDLADAQEYRIRGLYAGMIDGRTLRLDNCETVDPTGTKDPHRLTTDYLPHTPGKALTYDIAVFPVSGKGSPTVVRQVFFQEKDGVTKTETTFTGRMTGRSLFDPGDQSKWVGLKTTKSVRLPGPVYYQRLSGGFVEVGERVPTGREGETDTAWQPALKVGAKTGDTWKWTYANARHEYRLVKFEASNGRTSVHIKETVTSDADPDHVYEIRHVYVRGVGEAEYQQTQPVSPRETRILAEKKLVEDAPPPAKEGPVDKASPSAPPGG